ncbi:DNA cytosine methyltransferase [uncultured Sneathiella sp.]|uniref:DNA cytosine methyltransferase n=1 Tax=uncultured Sneathiella sp. TaxID=879315 RepID=UPI0030EE3147|tara:strand:- start:5725 stop:6609 length:885 start_codon:yes stop_codon:yes gene_type:complete
MYRYFSLFSGIGGFELGIGNRAECVGFSEIDTHAVTVFERHFPEHRNFGDITAVNPADLPDFDLLVGGFPCQAFSIAGKQQGFADPRGALFFDVLRLLDAKRPQLFLLENVKGLLGHQQGATFKAIISALDELGYDLQWQVLNSKDYGVPQNRERIFIIGHLGGTARPEVFPLAPRYQEGDGHPRHHANTLTTMYHKWVTAGTYVLEGKTDGLIPRVRRFTPMECERLQGFPDRWTEGIRDAERYRCLGNAVTVNVIDAITDRLLPTKPRLGGVLFILISTKKLLIISKASFAH